MQRWVDCDRPNSSVSCRGSAIAMGPAAPTPSARGDGLAARGVPRCAWPAAEQRCRICTAARQHHGQWRLPTHAQCHHKVNPHAMPRPQCTRKTMPCSILLAVGAAVVAECEDCYWLFLCALPNFGDWRSPPTPGANRISHNSYLMSFRSQPIAETSLATSISALYFGVSGILSSADSSLPFLGSPGTARANSATTFSGEALP